MADSTTYAISTVTRGMCLETRQNGTLSTGIYDPTGKTQAQLWVLEPSDDKKSIAFKSAANGQYLRSAGKGDGAKAQYGNKSWWTLEPGDAPALWWLKNNTNANYLANYGGSQAKNNTVQMWQSNLKGWSAALQWYVHPAKAVTSFPFSASADSADPTIAQNQQEELDSKDKALKEREANLETKEKEVSAKEAAAAKQAGDGEKREKAAIEKEADLKKQQSELDTKQKAAAEQQSQLEKREKALASKESSKKGTATTKGDNSNQISDLQRQFSEAQQELSKTKAALEKQQQASNPKATRKGATNPSGSGSSYSGASSDEIVNLRSRIAELESQLGKDGHAAPSASTQSEEDRAGRPDMRPIIMQQNFGFLPRLATVAELQMPPKLLPPATRVH